MRLHHLELTALGPFPGTERVDLDSLAVDGLFLLHGDTGAGKTSVLDAIAYALFGRVPGARQQAGRLRCDHAPPEMAPGVRLEFTVAGRRLRVRRSPEWQRPKRRGSGTTREPATALLEELQGGCWVGLSTRIDEVSHQLHDWIGMSAEQFFQVVLLPQGEFARFLSAESAEREELLERLFGTERFTDVQLWLAQRKRETAIALEASESESRRFLQRLCQAAGTEAADEPALEAADQPWCAGVVRAAEEHVVVAGQAADTAARSRAAAVAGAEQARSRRELQARRIAVEQERRAVEAAHEGHDRRCSAVADARKASTVRPLLAALAEAREDLRECAADVQDAGVDVRAQAPDVPGPGAAADRVSMDGSDAERDDIGRAELVGWEHRLRAECTQLDRLAEEEQERDDLVRAADAGEAEWAVLESALRAGRDRAIELPELLQAAHEAVAAGRQAEAGLPDLKARVDQLRDAAQAEGAAAALTERIDRLRGELREAVDRHQTAVDVVQDLRSRRLDGMAAELAGRLPAGEPCPVCGSAEHPAPAHPVGRIVTIADERAAARREQAAKATRVELEDGVQTAARERAGLVGRTGGRSGAELLRALDAAEGVCATAAAQAKALGQRTRALGVLIDEGERLTAQLDVGKTRQNELLRDGVAHRQRAAAIGERLAAARGADHSIGDRSQRLGELVAALAELVAAFDRHHTATRSAERIQRQAAAQARQAGFNDIDAAEAAAADAAQIQRWEQQIAEHERREAALAHQLAQPALSAPDVIALATQPELDLGPTEHAREQAEQRHTVACSRLEAARERADEVRRLSILLGRAQQRAAPLREEHVEVRMMADLVAGLGHNSRRMTLRAYVLAARLAEVAASASVRLRQMSSGRYSFEQTDEADSRRIRAGLGLVVLDDFTGRTRSTKTLSGGETFMASLALALGLADVVTAEAGGTALETLFIDEGFGALDADTLDLVMTALDELRAGGRVIGVVSHVEEMRVRIPSRLLVHKRRDGSTLEQVCA